MRIPDYFRGPAIVSGIVPKQFCACDAWAKSPGEWIEAGVRRSLAVSGGDLSRAGALERPLISHKFVERNGCSFTC